MRYRSVCLATLAALTLGAATLLAPAGTSGDRTEGLGTAPESSQGGSQATLRASSLPRRVRVGWTFTLEITSSGARNAAAVAFHVVYDPLLLEPVPAKFKEGPWLRHGGAVTSFEAVAASTGERVLVGVTRLGAARGAGSGGIVCRLDFRALAPGTTSIALDRGLLTSETGREMSARFLPAKVTITPAVRPGP